MCLARATQPSNYVKSVNSFCTEIWFIQFLSFFGFWFFCEKVGQEEEELLEIVRGDG